METLLPSAQVSTNTQIIHSIEIGQMTCASFTEILFEIGTKQRIKSQRKKPKNGTLLNHQKSTKE